MIYTFVNDFHDSEARLRAKPGQELSLAQIARVRRLLCGIDDCLCGGPLSERGDNPEIECLGYDDKNHLRIRISADAQ